MAKTLKAFVACALALALGGAAGAARAQDKTVVVEAIGSNPPHFNRLLSTDIATMLVGAKVYETLVRVDSNYTILPSLATAWQVNNEATEYRLTLRDGVKWHDGKPFSSADVKFTFDTYIPLSPAASAFARFVQEVSAPDDKTVVVKFNAPYAPFLEALAGMWMLPKHVFGDGQNVATHPSNARPIGTGPFKFDSFRSGDRVMLSRNNDYYGAKTDVQRMVFPILPDANSRKLALESGAIQYVYGSYIDKSAWPQIEKDARFAAMRERGHVLTVTAHLNTTKGPLANYEVRKAIFQALNRKAMGERAYYGYGTAARGPVPAEMSWATSDEVDYNRDLPFDPAAAKALLDKAGFPVGSDGTRFTISLAYQADFSSLGLAGGLMQSNLADVGIKLNLIAEDGQIWRDRVYKNGNYDIGMVFYTTFEDPSLGVTRAYICNPTKIVYRNASGLCDPALDADLAAAGATTDRAQRQAAFTRAEKRIEGLLHTYPLVVEKQFYFGRKDLWNLDKAHETHPIDWSLVKAR